MREPRLLSAYASDLALVAGTVSDHGRGANVLASSNMTILLMAPKRVPEAMP